MTTIMTTLSSFTTPTTTNTATTLPNLTLTPDMVNNNNNNDNNTSSTSRAALTPEELEQLRYYESTQKVIKESYMWVILAFGFPGNMLCLVVICRMRSLGSPALYISTLAVVDNLAIVVKVLLLQFGQYKVSVGPVGCKVMFFLGNQLVVYANWVLVAMAVERFFAVWQPLRVARVWTSHRAATGLGVLLLLTLALTSPLLFAVTVQDGRGSQTCIVDPQYGQMMRVWQWAQIAAYGFLPCTLLFTLNISIIVLIGRARRMQLSLTSSSSTSTFKSTTNSSTSSRSRANNRPAPSKNKPFPDSQSANCQAASKSGNRPHGRHPRDHTTPLTTRTRGAVQRQATVLLLVTSSVLVVTTTPVCVYLLVQQWWQPEAGSMEMARKGLCARVLRAVCDANHAVNFYLYFISARRFRVYVWKVMCWFCLRQDERRGSDVTTRHLSDSRSTVKIRNSYAQGHPLNCPRTKDRSGSRVEEGGGGGGGREMHVPLKLFEGEEGQRNGVMQSTSLL